MSFLLETKQFGAVAYSKNSGEFKIVVMDKESHGYEGFGCMIWNVE
jgi:hypothetical protein